MQHRRPQFDSWVRKIHWRRDRLPTPVFLGFPCGSAGKESTCNAGDLGLIPELGRSSGEEKGYPPQYSSLENSMDYIVHGGHKSQTRLVTFTNHFDHCTIFAPDIQHSTWNLIFPHFPSCSCRKPMETWSPTTIPDFHKSQPRAIGDASHPCFPLGLDRLHQAFP